MAVLIATTAAVTNFVFSSLITGINNGMVFGDDVGGNTGVWTSDGTGNFGRITYNNAGTSGFRWTGMDTTKTSVLIQYDLRWTGNDNTKEFKFFSKNYPTANAYSNFTAGCNVGGYTGTRGGLSYADDRSVGGDLGVQFFLDAAPTLTGGSSYTQAPPRIRAQPSLANNNENNAGAWQTIAHWFKQSTNNNADGEYARWYNNLTTPFFWCDLMTNCLNNGQGVSRMDWGAYANVAGVVVDVRNVFVGYTRPVGWGI